MRRLRQSEKRAATCEQEKQEARVGEQGGKQDNERLQEKVLQLEQEVRNSSEPVTQYVQVARLKSRAGRLADSLETLRFQVIGRSVLDLIIFLWQVNRDRAEEAEEDSPGLKSAGLRGRQDG